MNDIRSIGSVSGASGVFGQPPTAGWATGVGSLPGTDVRDAVRLVLDTLPDLPHLPELPARGPGAETTGRALVVAGHIAAQWGPTGWAVTDSPGRDLRRAASWLGEDLDVLEEELEGWDGPLKVQVCGPWTLAATLELRSGRRAVADVGAVRDLTQSLAEGLAAHVADVGRRVPGARLVVQPDEPALPSVLMGSLPTPSGLGALRSVEPVTVEAGLRGVLGAMPAGTVTVVHCCAAQPPVALFRAAGADALSLDATLLGGTSPSSPAGAAEVGAELAEAVDGGMGLLLGAVPTLGDDLPSVDATAALVRAVWRRTERPDEEVASVVVTPTCGLAGATPARARAVLDRCREVAGALADDPERVHG